MSSPGSREDDTTPASRNAALSNGPDASPITVRSRSMNAATRELWLLTLAGY